MKARKNLKLSACLVIAICALGIQAASKSKASEALKITPKAESNGIDFEIGLFGDVQLRGILGISLPLAVGVATPCTADPGSQCFTYGDFARVVVTSPNVGNNNCAKIEWTSTNARRLEDCFMIDPGMAIYGGGETFRQYWPINEEKRPEAAYVTGDFFDNKDSDYGGVVENYWLFSSGVAIHVDEDTPLFVSYNTSRANQLCFVAADQQPYKKRDEVTLKYSVCVGNNVKQVHQTAIRKFYDLPTGLPDETMLVRPFWSTWAQYKADVNQSIVLDFASKVVSEGFALSSHIEIDDNWETCYGSEEFNPSKFPNPKAMVDQIKAMGLRVTVWVHPFINYECELFNEGFYEGYFVKDVKGKAGITSWWAGGNSGAIDVTNVAAREWWAARLNRMKDATGVDAMKFDAGETNWLPSSISLTGDDSLSPNSYSTRYVDFVSQFGGLVEVRVARRSQQYPIFTRMLDKLSEWGNDNGLKSMIPTALHFGIVGYPFVLPDMIGGNAYGPWPSKELYVRWMQLNAFMPAVQFSLVPWDSFYDAETVAICVAVCALRESYSADILGAARQALVDGSPINRPMWWVDPTDPNTYFIEDQYMLGDRILAAPIVLEGAVSRNIYLPAGTWVSGVNNVSYTGPTTLTNYPAPLNVLPYFIKTS